MIIINVLHFIDKFNKNFISFVFSTLIYIYIYIYIYISRSEDRNLPDDEPYIHALDVVGRLLRLL